MFDVLFSAFIALASLQFCKVHKIRKKAHMPQGVIMRATLDAVDAPCLQRQHEKEMEEKMNANANHVVSSRLVLAYADRDMS
jgi:hypothetical protein